MAFPGLVAIVSTIIWGIEDDKDFSQTQWTIINDAFYTAFSGWAWLGIGRNTDINDDLLVHRDSQRATGYTGIADTYNKRFIHGGVGSTINFDWGRASEPTFPIAHNLEARDDDFIDWIMDRINTNFRILNVNANGNGVSISGFSNSFTPPNNFHLDIPETLLVDGVERSVIAIGNSAFAYQTQLSQITIPSSVGTTKSECVA